MNEKSIEDRAHEYAHGDKPIRDDIETSEAAFFAYIQGDSDRHTLMEAEVTALRAELKKPIEERYSILISDILHEKSLMEKEITRLHVKISEQDETIRQTCENFAALQSEVNTLKAWGFLPSWAELEAKDKEIAELRKLIKKSIDNDLSNRPRSWDIDNELL